MQLILDTSSSSRKKKMEATEIDISPVHSINRSKIYVPSVLLAIQIYVNN